MQWLISALGELGIGHISQGAFALLNAAILFCAIAVFVGFRASWDDIAASLHKPIPVPASSSVSMVAEADNVAVMRLKRPQLVYREGSREQKQERRAGM
jgi:hypothetical protein